MKNEKKISIFHLHRSRAVRMIERRAPDRPLRKLVNRDCLAACVRQG